MNKAFLIFVFLIFVSSLSISQEKKFTNDSELFNDSLVKQKTNKKNIIGCEILGNISSISYGRLIYSKKKLMLYSSISTHPLGYYFLTGKYTPNFSINFKTYYHYKNSLYLFNETGATFISIYFPAYIVYPKNINQDIPIIVGLYGITSSFGLTIIKKRFEFSPIFPTLLYIVAAGEDQSSDLIFGISIGSKISYNF